MHLLFSASNEQRRADYDNSALTARIDLCGGGDILRRHFRGQVVRGPRLDADVERRGLDASRPIHLHHVALHSAFLQSTDKSQAWQACIAVVSCGNASARHGGMMFQNPSAGSSAILEQRESPARGKATAHSRPMNLISTVQLVHSGRSHYSALVVQNNCSGTFRYRVFPNLPSETTRTFPLAQLF